MHILKVADVIIPPDRQRKEFKLEKLQELSRGIRQHGLIHAIVIRSLEKPELMAGERRLRAIRDHLSTPYRFDGNVINVGEIPCTLFGELDEADALEVELIENLHREDFTWQEKQDGIAKLHALRKVQKESVGERQTYSATARELKSGSEAPTTNDMLEVRNATVIAPFLNDEDVRSAKNEKEALAIVRRKLTQQFNNKLAENFSLRKAQSRHTLIVGSCIDVLPTLPSAQFDVIITDPPYGINAHLMSPLSGSNSASLHEYPDDIESAERIWSTIFTSGRRACKDAAHLYMFCDYRHFDRLRRLAEAAGWDVWDTPIIWHKPGGGMLGDSTRGPRKAYETILYARLGDKRVTGVYLDVIVEPGTSTSVHAAAKPVSVYVDLLRRSCRPGDKILDPCAGGCPIFPAANKLSLTATAIEVSGIHAGSGRVRMEEEE